MNYKKIFTVYTSLLFSVLTITASDKSELTILHTNDTHSQIDPNEKGRGGVLRRLCLIDSIKRTNRNVLIVDAGDAVQGTPYFTLFKGEPEQIILNYLSYDVQILGNHEFDNGLEALANNYRKATPSVISTNYSLEGTPLQGLIKPYVIKQIGEKRIGFIGLNINPSGMISDGNIKGVIYTGEVEAANRTTAYLRDSASVDMVVAVTHLGYTLDPTHSRLSDPELIASTRGIDLVIGGHSHTALKPGDDNTVINNLDDKPVLVVQNGSGGTSLGAVTVTFDCDTISSIEWKVYPIDSTLDNMKPDQRLAGIIYKYRMGVDSVMNIPLTNINIPVNDQQMLNMASDFVYDMAGKLYKNKAIDLAIMNKGGIRRNFANSVLTVGDIMSVFPFENYISIVEVKGSDLLKIFDIMARQKGNGVSSNVEAIINEEFSECTSVKVNGKVINPEQIYTVATIDYIANGGDNFTPMKSSKQLYKGNTVLYDAIIDAIKGGYLLKLQDNNPRFSVIGNPDFTIKNH